MYNYSPRQRLKECLVCYGIIGKNSHGKDNSVQLQISIHINIIDYTCLTLSILLCPSVHHTLRAVPALISLLLYKTRYSELLKQEHILLSHYLVLSIQC